MLGVQRHSDDALYFASSLAICASSLSRMSVQVPIDSPSVGEQETHQFDWVGGAAQRVKCLLLLHSFGVDRERAMAVCTAKAALPLTTNEARRLTRLLADSEIDSNSYKITEWERRKK